MTEFCYPWHYTLQGRKDKRLTYKIIQVILDKQRQKK